MGERPRQSRRLSHCRFLAQQTAEKAIKAFIYAQGEEIVLGQEMGNSGLLLHSDPIFFFLEDRLEVLM
jgi:hypothetical protein